MKGTRPLAPGAVDGGVHLWARATKVENSPERRGGTPQRGRGGGHGPVFCACTEGAPPRAARLELGEPGHLTRGTAASIIHGTEGQWGPKRMSTSQRLRTELQSGSAGLGDGEGRAARPPNHLIVSGVTVLP